jgi:DNA-binding IclR family transcriptional regulator
VAGSPPTERVISIVELLAARPAGCSVAEVTARLDLNRSTATAVLSTLEEAGWARRLPDRGYVLGAGLAGVAETVRAALPVLSGPGARRLDALAEEAGCGAALSLVGDRHLTFVALARGTGRFPAGIGVGTRLPLRPPAGAAVLAWRDTEEQRRWLTGAAEADRPGLRKALARARENGAVAWRLNDGATELLDVLAEVSELLEEHPGRRELAERVFAQLGRLAGRACTAAELASPGPLPISYLVAPVSDVDGIVRYELQLGPLAVTSGPAERERYVSALRGAARELSDPKTEFGPALSVPI